MALESKEPEYAKTYFEYLRHLTTLATGSIVLEIAFLDKAFPHPKWKAIAALSLIAFTSSVVGSVILYTMGLRHSIGEWTGDVAQSVGCWTLFITWGGFLLGIISLTVFALRNLFAL